MAAGVAFLALSPISLAAPPEGAAPASNREAEARARFEKGIELLEHKAWADALAEFLASRQLYPRATTTTNAVVCLEKLGRYDEALDLLEVMLREFPDLAADKRLAAETEEADLAKRVGAIALDEAEPGAAIVIDGRDRGASPAQGPLRVPAGGHVVRVSKEGFLPFEARVEVAAEQTTHLVVHLHAPPVPVRIPVPLVPPVSVSRRLPLSLEVDGAPLLVPSFGGDVVKSCTGGCSRSLGLGGYGVVRGGYTILPHLAFGLAAGYLAAGQTLTGRNTSLKPVGLLLPSFGTAADTLALHGVLAGAWASLRFGERYFVDLRLGAGAVLGWIGDVRTGTFHSSAGVSYSIGPTGPAAFVPFFHLAPEVRVGLRMTDHLELVVGVEVLVLFGSSRSVWGQTHPVNAGVDGTATFADESLVGPVVLALAPGLGARYRF